MLAAAAVSLVVFAAAAPAPTLVDASVGFQAGDVVYVGVDGANLRDKADLKGNVVAVVDFGAAARVKAAGPVVDVGGVSNRWYAVTVDAVEGFLFGNVVTRLAGSGNFDDDTAKERWAVMATSPPQLRVFSADDAHAIAAVDLGAGVVSVFDVAAVDGRDFVGVRVCAGAACDDAAYTGIRTEVRAVAQATSSSTKPPALAVTTAQLEAARNNAYDVKVRPPLTADQLTAFFDRNGCGAVADVDADSMGEARSQPACHAKDFSQNCAPDSFGCDAAQEGCEERCGDRCDGCQSTCAAHCSTCVAGCTTALCRRACARARGQCFGKCLAPVADCRAACAPAATRCWTSGQDRLRSECDCSAGADELKQQSSWCQERCAEQNQ